MPSLNNGLKAFYLDGKAVRKASLDGKVFFEKHNYNLNVESDKDILSYYDGDSATLTATLHGDDVANKEIFFVSDRTRSITLDSTGTYSFGNRFDIYANNIGSGDYIIGDPTALRLPYLFFQIKQSSSSSGLLEVSFIGTGRQLQTISVNANKPIQYMYGEIAEIKFPLSDGTVFTVTTPCDVTQWTNNDADFLDIIEYLDFERTTTNNNGVATHNYLSYGVGDVSFTVECMNLQETYVLTDAIFISNGDLNCSSNAQVTIETDGYTLSSIDPTGYGFVYYSTSSAGHTKWIRFDKGYNVEFEVLSYTGTNILRLDGSTNETIVIINATGKYRIEYLGTSTKVYLGDTLLTTVTTVDEEKNPRFRINANSTLKIKNWLYY